MRQNAFFFQGLVAQWLIAALVLRAALYPVNTSGAAPSPQAHAGYESGAQPPEELMALMKQAASAANARRPAGMAPFAEEDAEKLFAWAHSKTSTWQGSVLTLPDASRNAYLAVFHAWHTCESDGDHIHRLQRTPRGWKLGQEIPETDPSGFRVRDHDLHVQFDIPGHSAAIRDTIQVERSQDQVPAFGLLRLSQDFTVRRLTRDGPEGASVPFRQAGGVLAFRPPREKTFRLFLRYDGTVNHRGSDYILSGEATLNSYWYPHTARLPATATVTVAAPAGWTAIGQGDLVREEAAAGGGKRLVFRNPIPTCYFTLDAGPYHIASRKAGERTLYVYLLGRNDDLAQRSLDTLAKALTFYESAFTKYPYRRYTAVQTRGSFSGALEAYSFATFGAGTLPATIPHELAHTWWGGIAPCTYTRSMWNESFAEYSDGLFQRSGNTPSTPKTPVPYKKRTFRAGFEAVPIIGAFDTSDGSHSAVGYGKGALVLRVLEDQIGKEAMLRAMARFLADLPRGAAPEWPDFEKAVQTVTGKDYHWFFSQWTERTGLPQVRLGEVRITEEGGRNVVEADILQEKTPYRLRIPVDVQLRTGEIVRQDVEAEGPRTHVRVRVPGPPIRLTLDPDARLPLAAPSGSGTDDPTSFLFSEQP